MRRWIALAALMPVAVQAAGPFSKFEQKPKVAEYESKRPLEEIERCLIDMDGWVAPTIYRQPDRPDDVTLLWTPSGLAVARIDLHRRGQGTLVVSWMKADQALACAPK